LSELSRTIGNDRWRAEIFDGMADGQNLTTNLRRRFTVTPKLGLTVNFETIRQHSCEFAGSSVALGR
jgi:hypothetical protein